MLVLDFEFFLILKKFAPVFGELLDSGDVWKQMFEPRFQQFSSAVMSRIQYPTSSNSAKPAILDSAINEVLKGLHDLNRSTYQMAVSLVGEDALHAETYFLPLFNLDEIVEPYLKAWINNVLTEMPKLISRCVDNDKEDVEDAALK